MKIELHEITVKELAEGYRDNAEGGVVGFGGKLDIRPPYQREFIYKDKQRNAVIETVRRDFPLNVMYWAVRDDGGYEVIDGQQRTISICQYVKGEFSIPIDGNALAFHNLQDDQQAQILSYKCMVYFCAGTDSEKLEWFKTINIAGERLTDQELRNAVYHGPWTADAKRYFSRTACPAYQIAGDYMTGTAIRQEYLETAIKWHADATAAGTIEKYMSTHQHDEDAAELWHYFQGVIAWVKATFPTKRKVMKSVDWGPLYNKFGKETLNPAKLEKEVARLMQDEDVTSKPGIYPYVLNGDERHLNIRAFTPNMKREAYERQGGICVKCGKHFELDEMEGDHIKPWHEGGRTDAANCQMLCKDDNRRKSGR
jgi:hypothetical protein